ncbi:MAG: winged helix-turn-helix transcriptional regulator [Fidelibacterota bacterium]|nr:MAG: winged helix-turn-helix transcriptional regulator [Candidatus Neomarinimicrobiota bacterium]
MKSKDAITPTEAAFSRAARLLKVLGHPARMQILHFIEGGEETVSAIQKHVGLTQAMTSQHLKILFEAGLIQRRRQGTSIYYRVTEKLGKILLPCLRDCRELWTPQSVESSNA